MPAYKRNPTLSTSDVKGYVVLIHFPNDVVEGSPPVFGMVFDNRVDASTYANECNGIVSVVPFGSYMQCHA